MTAVEMEDGERVSCKTTEIPPRPYFLQIHPRSVRQRIVLLGIDVVVAVAV